ncbi:GNAT family N-acetyltransferase [Domibacillus enclensis]|uniref:Protein N-acetyltransferase, RimJ/RimL family n=1 Tax=Domibacillus enclensis TaxID=1017273 RepID=A0A1N6XRP3_9BACI|nr:GNAT family N-acetyltransferase [Domibacillus enclensis]OXS77411.1 hypothetical protein B1B05_11245 [Domibacillus enclensis]SIR04983.1 Protein N-acetyltransferase, RimJ/RimL family [Domibacillus enclensis]
MLRSVYLKPHSLTYADRIFTLTSAPEIREALDLHVETVDDTIDFLQAVLKEEVDGQTVSRAIFNEEDELIGITTLMFIDRAKKQCSLGTWIGYPYWGKGYNSASKYAILNMAFEELHLERVFVGARLVNERSQQAQKKLPFITWNVASKYPDVHEALEEKEKQPCLLNVVHRSDFPMMRAANKADIPAIQSLARCTWQDTYEKLIPLAVQNAFLAAAYSDEALLNRIDRGLFLVAMLHDQMSGFAHASASGDEAILHALYINPSAQSQKIGTLLLHRIVNAMPEVSRFTADVEKGNLNGERFYASKGFTCIDEFEEKLFGHTLMTKKMELRVH